MQRRQDAVRFVGVGIRERVEVQALFRNFPGDVLERLDLGRRQSKAGQPVGAGAEQRVVMKWVKCEFQPRPDC